MITKEAASASSRTTAYLKDTKHAAAYLGLSPHTLEAWRKNGGGPRFVKLRNAVRYRPEDLDAFIEASMRSNTSQVSA